MARSELESFAAEVFEPGPVFRPGTHAGRPGHEAVVLPQVIAELPMARHEFVVSLGWFGAVNSFSAKPSCGLTSVMGMGEGRETLPGHGQRNFARMPNGVQAELADVQRVLGCRMIAREDPPRP